MLSLRYELSLLLTFSGRKHKCFVCFDDLTALLGLGLPIVEVSRSHSDTPHSVGLLWTSGRPDAEIST